MTLRAPLERQAQGRRRWRAGFTLIEVVVGVAASIVLAAIAMNFLLQVEREAARAEIRAQMNRDAQVLFDLLEYDLVYFGAGVPFGDNGGGQDLIPATRRSRHNALVFVGDLPYPNTEVNGTMMIGGVAPGTRTAVVTSELSGACRPWASGAAGNRQCDTRLYTSVGLPTGTGNMCSHANRNVRTCPWGMLKWQNGASSDVAVLLNRPDGSWDRYTHTAEFGLGAGQLQDVSDSVAVDMATGPNFAAADSGVGSAFVQLDRVLWAIEEEGAAAGTECTGTCAIWRRQCWGDGGANPDAAGFPGFASTFYGTDENPTGCVPPDGTPWEKVAGGLQSASFFYFEGGSWQADINADTTADDIRGVALEATFRRAPHYGGAFVQTYRRQVFLDNRDVP